MNRRLVLLGLVALLLAATPLTAQTLFGINHSSGGRFLATIDPETAALTQIGPVSFEADGLAFAPDGSLYAVDNDAHVLVLLDPDTAEVLDIRGSFGADKRIEGLAAHPLTGDLWGAEASQSTLVRLDSATGAVSVVGAFGVGFLTGLEWSPDGATLYAASCTGGLYTVDPAAGTATFVGTANGGCHLALAADPVDARLYTVLWAGGADMTLGTISVEDGAFQPIGTMKGGAQIEGLTLLSPVGPYGEGCAATFAPPPKLVATPGLLTAGEQVALSISSAPSGSLAFLYVGTEKASEPMGLGCSLLVSPALPLVLGIPLGGPGVATWATVVPATAAGGGGFVVQAFVVDEGSGVGFANSNGVRLEVK